MGAGESSKTCWHGKSAPTLLAYGGISIALVIVIVAEMFIKYRARIRQAQNIDAQQVFNVRYVCSQFGDRYFRYYVLFFC